jgi:Protein of unknown function (DUF4058)
MPSPFPGMDPYLEAQPFWGDVHPTLISVMKGSLKKRLPRNYTVWSDIYIWLHEPDAEARRVKPDDFVTTQANQAGGTILATLPAPLTAILPAIRREGNKYLLIKELPSERVITVLELLSPANKTPGDEYDAFLAKRNEYLATRTNVVEIDLHRMGLRMPMGDPVPPPADYYAFVSRAADFPQTAIWPFSVRDQLPEVAVPLKPEDGFIMLPLQDCFDAAYDMGPYDLVVDYTRPPRIPLHGEDAQWAEALLKGMPGQST